MNVLERCSLAKNPETTSEQLDRFTEKHEFSASVRYSVAQNPKLSYASQIAMAVDDDVYVRRAIYSQADLSAEILGELGLDDEDEIVRRLVAGHPNTFLNTLLRLANDKEELVRATVAGHPRATPELLASLAVREDVPLVKDKNVQVRYAVAKNPKCPTKTLILLIQDPAGYVAEAARTVERFLY